MNNIDNLIQDLAKNLAIDKKIITKHINQLNKKDKSNFNLTKMIQDNNYNFIFELFKKHLFSKDREFIASVLTNKLSDIANEYDLLFKFTKRTKFKQQQTLSELEKLPDYIQEKYFTAAKKILNWVEYSFISEQTSKVIADIQPGATIENHNIDLRATFYEKNHPQDLNLIFKKEPNSLKRLTWDELTNHFSCIKKINSDFEDILGCAEGFLENLAQFLEKNNNPKLIKKFFKRITASPSYYEIIIEPEILIVDFSKIKLPSAIEVDYNREENILYLNFDNQFNLKCESELKENEKAVFTVKFNDIPTDLDLISV